VGGHQEALISGEQSDQQRLSVGRVWICFQMSFVCVSVQVCASALDCQAYPTLFVGLVILFVMSVAICPECMVAQMYEYRDHTRVVL
jgi:hypothetical protein